MTERIDHANEARAQLIDAGAYAGVNMLAQTGESKTDVLLTAQVHATLAVAEQLRVANLIALWMGDSALVDDDNFDRVGDDIKKALGL